MTTERFPRASRDNCLRSADVFAGPYRREVRYIPGRIQNALYWTASVALLTGFFYTPEVYSWLAR